MPKQMDHIRYPLELRRKDTAAVRFIMADAYKAMKAMPDGENAGYYADEVNYCADELARRGVHEKAAKAFHDQEAAEAAVNWGGAPWESR